MAEPSQQYCLRWNKHNANLLNVFEELLVTEAFTDVTLAVDGGTIKCHKIVLAACSSYFQNLFLEQQRTWTGMHPIVVFKDVKYLELKAILEYMYKGEVNVAQDQLGTLLKLAEVLKVKGLVEENGGSRRFVTVGDGRRGGRQEEEEEEEEEESSSSPPPLSPRRAMVSPQPTISTSITTSSSVAHSSGHVSPPHSTGGGAYDLYGGNNRSTSVIADHSGSQSHHASPLPLWQLPQLHRAVVAAAAAGHQSTAYTALGGGDPVTLDNGFENSSLKRKKPQHQQTSDMMMNRNIDTPILRTVLGQGHADSSQTGLPLLQADSLDSHYHHRAGADRDERRGGSVDLAEFVRSPYNDVSTAIDEDEKRQPSPQPAYAVDTKTGSFVNYVPVQKQPEWKRYKQYTKEDVLAAIEAVRTGMSAVQAARKHGVPSRTLYDKVKKLGISTTRPSKRAANGSGSCASYRYGGVGGGNVNGGIYGGGLLESESEHSNTENTLTGALEVVYQAKPKDLSQGTARGGEPAAMPTDATSRACSPAVIRRVKQEQEEMEDQVEDLSVSRKPEISASPSTSNIKDEPRDTGPGCFQ